MRGKLPGGWVLKTRLRIQIFILKGMRSLWWALHINPNKIQNNGPNETMNQRNKTQSNETTEQIGLKSSRSRPGRDQDRGKSNDADDRCLKLELGVKVNKQ